MGARSAATPLAATVAVLVFHDERQEFRGLRRAGIRGLEMDVVRVFGERLARSERDRIVTCDLHDEMAGKDVPEDIRVVAVRERCATWQILDRERDDFLVRNSAQILAQDRPRQ
jgi:hypothetical protein